MTDTPCGQCRAICVGNAGTGKTTLAKRLAYLWATDQHSDPFWTKVKVIIFATSKEEGDDLEQTLRNSIKGSDSQKDAVLHLWKEEPESVLVIIEAFDEFQKLCVIEQTMKKIKNQALNAFVTIRKDHPHITAAFISMFNQYVEVNGFTPKDGAVYMGNVLQALDCQNSIQEFLNAIAGKPEFETNPLNLMLACQLYAEGDLKTTDIDTLTEINLYSMRESRMVERECVRHDRGNVQAEEVIKVQRLAFYTLMKNNSKVRKSDLDNLNIDQDSPCLILMNKHEQFTAKHGHEEWWDWPHSRLKEFDVAMALTTIKTSADRNWFYWIASKPELNPVTELAVAELCNTGRYQEVKMLTSAILGLQSKAKCKATSGIQVHSCHWIVETKDIASKTCNIDTYLTGEDVKERTVIEMPDIKAITQCCGSSFLDNVSLFQHIRKCWQLGLQNKDYKEHVSNLQHLLLPAKDRFTLCPIKLLLFLCKLTYAL